MDHASLSVTEHALSSLPTVFGKAGIGPDDLDYYSTPTWFANLAANCLPPPHASVVLRAGGVALPLRVGPVAFGPLSGWEVRSLTNFYSCRFVPPGLERSRDPVGAMAALGREIRRRGVASLRFDALDAGPKTAIQAGLRRAGWLVEPFRQFGNWYLNTEGLTFERYWRERPGALRNTGRRRYRALIERGDGQIVRYAHPDEAEAAIRAYEAVYAKSWQAAEPFPGFMPALIRSGFAEGEAQVWCLRMAGVPVASQVWVCRHGRATIFKLAYDQDWSRQSVGTVLTMAAMQAALADGGLAEIDFGWGDDAYKQEWLPDRRQRYGIAAYNPRSLLGLALALRNLGPHKIRDFLARFPLKRSRKS